MASLASYLPEPGSTIWRRDRSSSREQQVEGNKVRHVVIREAEIREKPSPHVVYKVDVLTENDHWYLYRRYSQFHALHRKLVKQYSVSRDLLPPKKLSGNLSKGLIDRRRQLLEQYLQKLIHSEPQVSQSQQLLAFLDLQTHDVVKVADVLTRHLYRHGDKLLEEDTPIALSVNEMYSITKRLRLPMDAQGVDPSDIAADPAHLYSFVHQLQRLRVTPPPTPISVCCMPFEMAPFRSLHGLKLDKVPLSQVKGLQSIQQQLQKLSVHRSIRSLRELLIEAVEENRGVADTPSPPPTSKVEGWRLTATAKLTENRVVVQPWHNLTILSLSHNQLTHLDDSLQVLPVLKELNLSHNLLQTLELPYLCLPTLQKLTISHNAIQRIQDDKKVLEHVTDLDLAHNRLHSLEGLHAFVAMTTLNLSYNLVSSRADLDRLTQLRRLGRLTMTGNPITASHGSRLVVLAKFMLSSRTIALDGQEPTSREQAKIRSLQERYGSDPDTWPLAKGMPSGTGGSAPGHTPPPGDPRPPLQLSWQVHSPGDRHGNPVARHSGAGLRPSHTSPLGVASHGHHSPAEHLDYSIISEDSMEQPLLVPRLVTASSEVSGGVFNPVEEEEHYSIGNLSIDSCLLSREDPDGQSDISTASPEALLVPPESDPPSPDSLTPPPSTPLLTNGNNKPQITPSMILSALEALGQIQNKHTPISLSPRENTPTPIFHESITSALTAWITVQSASLGNTPLVSPPPSTPLEGNVNQQKLHRPISASDLISALSLMTPQEGGAGGEDSGENSAPYTVPQCTPQEGAGITEWLKLGIRPEEVIQALSALTIQSPEDAAQREEHGLLSPISEEQPTFPGSGDSQRPFAGREAEEGYLIASSGGSSGIMEKLVTGSPLANSSPVERLGSGFLSSMEEGEGLEVDTLEDPLYSSGEQNRPCDLPIASSGSRPQGALEDDVATAEPVGEDAGYPAATACSPPRASPSEVEGEGQELWQGLSSSVSTEVYSHSLSDGETGAGSEDAGGREPLAADTGSGVGDSSDRSGSETGDHDC